MALARAYEKRNPTPLLALPAPPARPPRHNPGVPGSSSSAVAGTGPTPPASTTPLPRPFKHLTPTEMAEHCKLGLCYNCDELYVRGHKCPHLFYLEVTDYVVEPEDDEPLADTAAAEPAAFEPETPMISLHAIAGIHTEDTMQLYIMVGNEKFVALLDSGSTHNFIRGDVACRVGLQFQACPGAGVIVANSDRVACRGLAVTSASASSTRCSPSTAIPSRLTATTWCSTSHSFVGSGPSYGTLTTSAWPSGARAVGCSSAALAPPDTTCNPRSACTLSAATSLPCLTGS